MPVQIFSNIGMEQMDVDFQSMFERIMPKQNQQRQLPIKEARKVLHGTGNRGPHRPPDGDRKGGRTASRTRASSSSTSWTRSAARSRARARTCPARACSATCCPWWKGRRVNTRYGPVRTDHILFIAAGAFHLSKPSDLMPELQGRFPIRVELTDLKQGRFPAHPDRAEALADQAIRRAAGDRRGRSWSSRTDGIEALADIAFEVNRTAQNIGARRLHTILERVVEDLSFEGPDLADKHVTHRRRLCARRLEEIMAEGRLEQVYFVMRRFRLRASSRNDESNREDVMRTTHERG